MLQTKKINNDTVAVSFDPTTIYIRHSGKSFYGSEEVVVEFKNDKLVVNESILKKYGLDFEVISKDTNHNVENEKPEKSNEELADEIYNNKCNGISLEDFLNLDKECCSYLLLGLDEDIGEKVDYITPEGIYMMDIIIDINKYETVPTSKNKFIEHCLYGLAEKVNSKKENADECAKALDYLEAHGIDVSNIEIVLVSEDFQFSTKSWTEIKEEWESNELEDDFAPFGL